MWPTRAGRLDRPTLTKFVDSTRSSLPLPERPSDESAARSPMLPAFTHHVGVVQGWGTQRFGLVQIITHTYGVPYNRLEFLRRMVSALYMYTTKGRLGYGENT